jgi:GTP-binding protein HflX
MSIDGRDDGHDDELFDDPGIEIEAFDGDEQAEDDAHRGAFGEFGGESGGLIERTFRERIIIVGLSRSGEDDERTDQSLDELALLVDTAGADAVARVVQRRAAPDPGTYLGRGKIDEIRSLAEHLDVDTVVFDDELSPGQQFNLEKLLGRTALDRTAVILDIFAQNAHSQEGKAQVELAMLRYRLPRLRGSGRSLSQQAGATSTRGGPGETQTEIDRRSIRRRIHKLDRDLTSIAAHRQTQRKARRQSRLKNVAIVGYTNAGKSTLLNRLTEAGVLVEDRLFATLDATTRRLDLPGGEPVLVTDTVGFITKLPHGLVEAFKSTLELVGEADLLVHVVDASGPDPHAHIEAVHEVLREIGAGDVPELLAFNKADLSAEDAARLAKTNEGAVSLSARTGEGLDRLLVAIGERLRAGSEVVELIVPFGRGDVLASIHREGEVLAEQAREDAMVVTARLEQASRHRLREWVADGPPRAVVVE